MLGNIRTSLANKDVVSELTNKLQLGAENIIARIAFMYSLSKDTKLDLANVKDAKGKEYNLKVLFGIDNIPVYVALICEKYELPKSSKYIGKYIKMHVDDGLEQLQKEYKRSPGLSSVDFLMSKIEAGLTSIN